MARITKIYNEGRKSPFQVLWRDKGKRYSRFFATEADRDKFIEMNAFLEDDQFAVLFNLSKEEITDVAKIKLLKGELTYREIWQFWAKHHRAQEMITCWNACNAYIIDLRRDGRSERHVVRVRRILELFCETFGEAYLESITRKELENWIAALPYAGQTKQNYKSIIRTAWSFFEKNEWITRNVAVRLTSEKIVKGEIGILTVEETEKLLRANENVDPEICGLMALGLFAGMRSSAIARVDYDELNFKERGIETPAHKTKKTVVSS